MDVRRLIQNAASSWKSRAKLSDFATMLGFIYSHRWPRWYGGKEYEIGFCYPTPIGLIRLCVRRNHGADNFIRGEVFEHRYYDVPLSRAPKNILDLGANAGFTAVWFGRMFPQAAMACVEPMPDNVRVLRRNLEMNGIPARVFVAAIDSMDGALVMERAAMDFGHSVSARRREAEDPGQLDVVAVSVPTVMREMGWQVIDVVKIDIEGHEKHLLTGDAKWLRQVNNLFIEWHYPGARKELQVLADMFGFRSPRDLPGIWFLERAEWVGQE